MPYRIIGLALVVLGVVSAALGVASATVWRADSTVTASTHPASDAPTLVTTGPGVLGLVDDKVSITARAADGGDVVIAVGRADDVAGWVGDDPVTQVTGMTDWSTLATKTTSGEAPKTAPDPSSSDMWVSSTSGSGEVTLPWTARDGRWSVLVAAVGDDAQAPTLALTWDREVTTPWLWPLVLVGLVLVVVGLVVMSLGRLRTRNRHQEAVLAAARTNAPPAPAPAGVGEASPSTTTTLTRRELREQALREAQNQQRRRGGRRGKTGDEAPLDPAAGVPAPPADEPATSTVAIPVDETAKGAADAWRRRWNVPARIPPIQQQPGARQQPGAPSAPQDVSGPSAGSAAPAPGTAPHPDQPAPPPAPPASPAGTTSSAAASSDVEHASDHRTPTGPRELHEQPREPRRSSPRPPAAPRAPARPPRAPDHRRGRRRPGRDRVRDPGAQAHA
ncbi:hypothetical protein GCM10025864_30020 [Luteimicrobium album]|uniref:Uncharacterized protein n=1 Tax=Luteimicrobium album TaxID=1054550 RepID=A0ABQ6I3A5_9MICO|nr:hypothetical protein [Luteimicrobium album]GMA25243.1 hypothetical protein GCM10025864_30020 [Luteimicrobium album]